MHVQCTILLHGSTPAENPATSNFMLFSEPELDLVSLLGCVECEDWSLIDCYSDLVVPHDELKKIKAGEKGEKAEAEGEKENVGNGKKGEADKENVAKVEAVNKENIGKGQNGVLKEAADKEHVGNAQAQKRQFLKDAAGELDDVEKKRRKKISRENQIFDQKFKILTFKFHREFIAPQSNCKCGWTLADVQGRAFKLTQHVCIGEPGKPRQPCLPPPWAKFLDGQLSRPWLRGRSDLATTRVELLY